MCLWDMSQGGRKGEKEKIGWLIYMIRAEAEEAIKVGIDVI